MNLKGQMALEYDDTLSFVIKGISILKTTDRILVLYRNLLLANMYIILSIDICLQKWLSA